MIDSLFYLFNKILKLPHFAVVKSIDLYFYIKEKRWRIWDGFGLHIYLGLFGKGKTISMVERAYRLAKRYPYLNIYTNINLYNFPDMDRIHKLESYQQIIDAPGDSLFIIDEISTIFSSRKWADFPPALMGQLLQTRKRKKMILATAQRFSHVDKLIRDITFTVIDCSTVLGRWTFLKFYDPVDWENQNAMNPAVFQSRYNFIQTNKVRNLYDTEQLIDDVQKQKFLSNEEIINRQGAVSNIFVNTAQKKKGLLSAK